MSRPLEEFVRRRGQLPPAPKAEEDWRDQEVRQRLEAARTFGLAAAQELLDEATRMDREILTAGYREIDQRSRELKHHLQTTATSEVDQRTLRRELEGLVRETARLDRLAETAQSLAEQGEAIRENPERYEDDIREKFGLRGGALPW